MDRKLRMEELGRVDAEAYRSLPKRSVVVVLEDVRSRHNVGSVFRTADAFGIEGLYLCGFTPCPPHREIEKTALGATGTVPWQHRTSALEVVRELTDQGYRVRCVEQTLHAVPLDEWRSWDEGKIALVFGNELNGVSEEVIRAASGSLVVPQHGTKHSLNVSVCAGIVLWRACERRPGIGGEEATKAR